MQSRHLRLLEFAPNRTVFNQILKDTTIHMGFECELITDQEETRQSEAPDYDSMSWEHCADEVHISRRTRDRIQEEYFEWLSNRAYQALNEKWSDEEDEYTRKWAEDNGHLRSKHDMEQDKRNFYEAAILALRKLGHAATASDDFNVSADKILLYVDGEISEGDVERLNSLLADEMEDAYGEIHIQQVQDGHTELVGQVGEEQDVDDIVDTYRDDAREAFDEEYREEMESETEGDMDEFIEDEYRGSNTRLMSAFDIDYESTEDEEVDASDVYHDMSSDLRQVVGRRVKVGGYDKDPEYWYIEPDGSLEGDGYITAEVVSSVYTVGEGLDALQTTFQWMKDRYYTTNASTGLHVSFSIEGFESGNDYDFLKMMVLFDENYTASIFNRLNAYYAQQLRDVLFSNFANTPNPVAAMSSRQIADTIVNLHRITKNMTFDGIKGPGNSKYFSFRHRSDGVVEFRSMGGTNYEKKFDVIRKRIVNMAYLMKVGSDPALMARDYIMSVYKMLTGDKFKDPELGSGQGRVDQPTGLSTFQTIFDRNPKMVPQAVKHPVGFLQSLARGIQAKQINIGPLQTRQLRFYIARQKIQSETVRSAFQDDSEYNVLANLMRWPLVVPGKHDPAQETLPFARHGSDLSGTPDAVDPEDDGSTPQERYRLRRTQGGLGGGTDENSFRTYPNQAFRQY